MGKALAITRYWHAWCQRLGLKENLGKVRYVAKRAVDKLALLQDGVREDSVVSSARVLTVDFVDNAGADHPTVRNQSKGEHTGSIVIASGVRDCLSRGSKL